MSDSIYLDNQATTPTDPRVRDAVLPFLEANAVGNPHSEHVAGRQSAMAIEAARCQIADLIGAGPEEIVFTSGATEANSISLQGIARSQLRRGDHVLTCATEHRSVLETMSFLEHTGFRVDVLPVDSSGAIDCAMVADAITRETALVSIMTANNEIGVIHPIGELAAICRSRGVVFHTDAAQAVGKIPLDVKALGVDLLSLSGHKFYAPIGVGALYISEESAIRPEPLFWGGGQERGLRSGTLAPHLCIALGAASTVAIADLASDAEAAAAFRQCFLQIVRARCPDIRVNGERNPRLPGNLSLTFPGVDADHLIGALQPEIAVSRSAACSSGVLRPSHVLLALGLSEADAESTIRISFGRFNNRTQVEAAAYRIAATAAKILEDYASNTAVDSLFATTN